MTESKTIRHIFYQSSVDKYLYQVPLNMHSNSIFKIQILTYIEFLQ